MGVLDGPSRVSCGSPVRLRLRLFFRRRSTMPWRENSLGTVFSRVIESPASVLMVRAMLAAPRLLREILLPLCSGPQTIAARGRWKDSSSSSLSCIGEVRMFSAGRLCRDAGLPEAPAAPALRFPSRLYSASLETLARARSLAYFPGPATAASTALALRNGEATHAAAFRRISWLSPTVEGTTSVKTRLGSLRSSTSGANLGFTLALTKPRHETELLHSS
mmetsp:Transcript_15229/g.36224  ORF Transcript_15229/g.36224 Transcript_15229/m.36224 type:complete len:220 (-) Transcript_15229:1187-1846(-)